jgi:hypothetical protein
MGNKADQHKLIAAARAAFKKLEKRKSVSRDDLAPILESARSPWVASRTGAGHLLAALAAQHPAAQECIREMMASRKSQERDGAVYLLNDQLPRSLSLEVLRQALDDRSSTVRVGASRKCDMLELRELVPELERRIALETDPRAKQTLEFHTAILRDGYVIQGKGEDLSICIRVKGRWSSGWSNQLITKKDLGPKKLKAIIAKMRAEWI